jgi:hypothetical protein
MKIRTVEAELLRAEGWRDGETDRQTNRSEETNNCKNT